MAILPLAGGCFMKHVRPSPSTTMQDQSTMLAPVNQCLSTLINIDKRSVENLVIFFIGYNHTIRDKISW